MWNLQHAHRKIVMWALISCAWSDKKLPYSMLASRICCYLNEYYLTKYVCFFPSQKGFWNASFGPRLHILARLGSICCDMFAAIFNLCNKNLILFVTNSIILKAFRKLYNTQQIMLVSSLSAVFFPSGMLPVMLKCTFWIVWKWNKSKARKLQKKQ